MNNSSKENSALYTYFYSSKEVADLPLQTESD